MVSVSRLETCLDLYPIWESVRGSLGLSDRRLLSACSRFLFWLVKRVVSERERLLEQMKGFVSDPVGLLEALRWWNAVIGGKFAFGFFAGVESEWMDIHVVNGGGVAIGRVVEFFTDEEYVVRFVSQMRCDGGGRYCLSKKGVGGLVNVESADVGFEELVGRVTGLSRLSIGSCCIGWDCGYSASPVVVRDDVVYDFGRVIEVGDDRIMSCRKELWIERLD